MTDIIPAGESGTFTITGQQLRETEAVSLEAFEALLLAEAEARGLLLEVANNVIDHSISVTWRPAPGNPYKPKEATR